MSVLSGKKALVTAGPTVEAIDPVRHITNRSSGKQGYAIASVLAKYGVNVSLVSGPTSVASPSGVEMHYVKSAEDMLSACEALLPVDIVVCVAAVSDWKVAEYSTEKMKKKENQEMLTLNLIKNPDILAALSQRKHHRPQLVVGFAAETENVIENAKEKLLRKQCDWIVANDVQGKVFDKDVNAASLITKDSLETWSDMLKVELAKKLVLRMEEYFTKILA